MLECGGCTLCCKLMGIPELEKKPGKWCTHCAVGQGCKIYADRPESCRVFDCMYRLGPPGTDIKLRPDKCKVVIAPTTNPMIISAHVDPGYPDAWKKEPVHSLLKRFAASGLMVVIGPPNSLEKIVLKKGAMPGMINQSNVIFTPPDASGMQWYNPPPKLRQMKLEEAVTLAAQLGLPTPHTVEDLDDALADQHWVLGLDKRTGEFVVFDDHVGEKARI